MLNFRTETIDLEVDAPPEFGYPLLEIYISIDSEIYIAERVVKDAVTLFGDIGGFSGFFLSMLGLLVGSIPEKLFGYNTASNLYRTSKKKNRADAA